MKETPVFEQLPVTIRRGLLRRFPLQYVQKGEAIHHRFDASSRVMWIVMSGHIQGLRNGEGPPAKVICESKSGEILGWCCAWRDQPYACRAVAAENSTVWPIPVEAFRELVVRHPAFRMAVTSDMSRRLRTCLESATEQTLSVDFRMRLAVRRLMRECGRVLPITRRELAQLAGTTVESAIRTVRRWERSGWVRSYWKGMAIVKKDPFVLRKRR